MFFSEYYCLGFQLFLKNRTIEEFIKLRGILEENDNRSIFIDTFNNLDDFCMELSLFHFKVLIMLLLIESKRRRNNVTVLHLIFAFQNFLLDLWHGSKSSSDSNDMIKIIRKLGICKLSDN